MRIPAFGWVWETRVYRVPAPVPAPPPHIDAVDHRAGFSTCHRCGERVTTWRTYADGAEYCVPCADKVRG